MARYTHTFNPNGRFTEQDTGNVFEFSANDQPFFEGFNDKVWVLDGFRHAKVLKTRAHIVVDEDEFGNPVVETWHFRQNSRVNWVD
jgi:hypothetical protein